MFQAATLNMQHCIPLVKIVGSMLLPPIVAVAKASWRLGREILACPDTTAATLS